MLLLHNEVEWDSNLHHIPCLDHVLNLCIQDFLKSVRKKEVDPKGDKSKELEDLNEIPKIKNLDPKNPSLAMILWKIQELSKVTFPLPCLRYKHDF